MAKQNWYPITIKRVLKIKWKTKNDSLSSGVVSTCLGEDSSNFTKQLGKN